MTTVNLTTIRNTVEVIEGAVTAVQITTAGPQGPQGIPAPAVPTYIQSTQPTVSELAGYVKYAWWDTSGGDLTLWIEDGI